MTAGAPLVRYLVYDEDGAGLVYSGVDEAAYTAARQTLARNHAGALVGQCMMGRERWVVVSYHRAPPDEQFVKRRRQGGLLGLTWEPVLPANG
jgi:hypothetical protein